MEFRLTFLIGSLVVLVHLLHTFMKNDAATVVGVYIIYRYLLPLILVVNVVLFVRSTLFKFGKIIIILDALCFFVNVVNYCFLWYMLLEMV